MKKLNEGELKEIKNFSKKIRKHILDMALHAGASSSHFGGALSIVEIISTLFSYQMNLNEKNKYLERNLYLQRLTR